jgi:subfamily B ATP-binding cassette protein MsbA
MKGLLGRIDPRVSRELVAQRHTIAKGLACVLLGSVLTALTIKLTERAIAAIEVASGRPGSRSGPAAGLPEGDAPALGWLDQALSFSTPDEALRALGIVCLAVVGVFLLKYWFTRGQSYYLGKASAKLTSDLRKRLYRKLQRLPLSYFNDRRTGAIQSVLSNDVNVYQSAVGLVRDSIEAPVKAVLATVMIFLINWQLALVAILAVPVIAAFVQSNSKRMRAAQAQVQADLAELSAVSQEVVSGVRVVKAFAAEDAVQKAVDRLVDRQYQSQLGAVRRFAQLRPMVELIGAVSLAGILYICGHMARWGTLQISQIVALTLSLDYINQGMRSLANLSNTFSQIQAAADRIYGEVLEVPEEVLAIHGSKTISDPVGRIEFQEVSFEYPDGTRALDRVSFTIEPNSSVALVGPSGAGKSTLADLLLRFYDPTEGRILFDGNDVRELDLSWYRSQFGVVPQQTFLFAGSVEENLRLGDGSAPKESLAEAARAADAAEFIAALPQGYATVLGERGLKVSGGQAQRLAIARALVHRPRILLLDEATSNLDAISERAVTESLERLIHERTTLLIAHRLTTAARADKLVVLRRGQVVESGSHTELLAQGGAYASMYRVFLSGLSDEQLD